MAGAGSGGCYTSAGYRYSHLSCAPALAMQSARPKCIASLYAGFEAADLWAETAHLVTCSNTALPRCSYASFVSSLVRRWCL